MMMETPQFSYTGDLHFDGKGNVTLSVDDFNKLLQRDADAQRLGRERDGARRVAVMNHLRFLPDCEDIPDPLRSQRHTAVGMFGISWEEAVRLFPGPDATKEGK